MTKKVVCVRDSKTEIFGVPTIVTNLAEAERQFRDLVQDKSTLIGKHPEDFALWCLGSYDELTGAIESQLLCVAVGSDFVTEA